MNGSITANCEVLVVGAGPCGLTLACDLRRRGVGVRLVERLDRPVHASKGKGLSPRSLEVFDDLGFADAMVAAGRTYPLQRLYDGPQVLGDRAAFGIDPVTPQRPYPNTLMLPQWKTEDFLRERLDSLGGRIEHGTALIAFQQDVDGIIATLEGPSGRETVTAAYLVGADGGRSTVRKGLGLRLVGETPALEGLIVADVLVDGLDRDHWHIWEGTGLMKLGFCPLPSTDAFQFMSSVAHDQDPPMTLEHLQALTRAISGRDDLVLHDLDWISLFRPNVRMAERFRDRRVFIAGDAAHVHPPTGGQGLNTSVQDAYNLGWKLGAVLRGADPVLLDTYDEERLPIAAQLLPHADGLYRGALSQEATSWTRGEREKQLLISYRGSSLAVGESQGTLQPGDRMPDMQLTDRDGAGHRLFDLMRGPHAVLLAVGAKWPEGGKHLRVLEIGPDGFAETEPVLGALRRYWVVRPDGYIGAISHDVSVVTAFLASILPAT